MGLYTFLITHGPECEDDSEGYIIFMITMSLIYLDSLPYYPTTSYQYNMELCSSPLLLSFYNYWAQYGNVVLAAYIH